MRHYVYRRPGEPPARATASGDQNVITLGAIPVMRACPAWGCDGPPAVRFPGRVPVPFEGWGFANPWGYAGPGATSLVPQPPPTSGGTLTVSNPNPVPLSPTPAPTVAADTSLSLAQPGQTLAQQTGTPWDLKTWLGESTLFSSVPNWAVAGGAAVLAFMFLGKGGRR